MRIRPARPDEADRLTDIAFAAKGHWGYEQAQLESWTEELTYTPEYIETHWVVVAEVEAHTDAQIVRESDAKSDESGRYNIVGVCSLDEAGDQLEIAGMWVSPDALGTGVGRRLLTAALARCQEQGVAILRLLSDPNAQGFYEKMGAVLIGHERGSPTGRLLPLMHFNVEGGL